MASPLEDVPDAQPWVRFLPADALDEFVQELLETTHADVQADDTAPVSLLLAAWRHTAEVYSDPELFAILSRPHHGDHGPVPIPEAAATG